MTEEQKGNSDEFASVGAPSSKVLRSPECVAMDEAVPGKVHLRVAKPFLKADDKGLRALAYFETARAYAEIAGTAWSPAKWKRLSQCHYEKALELFPFWGSAARNLAATLIEDGKHPEAKRVILEAIAFVKQELAGEKRLGPHGARTVGGLYQNLIAVHNKGYSLEVDRTNQWANIQHAKTEVTYLDDALALLRDTNDPVVSALCSMFRERRDREQAFVIASVAEHDAWVKRGCKG